MRLSVLKHASVKVRSTEGIAARLGAFLGGFDWLQILMAMCILAFGIVFIKSTGEQVGSADAVDAWTRQLMWCAIGGAAWTFFALCDYRKLEPAAWLIFAGALVLLVAVLLFAEPIYGARRWLILKLGPLRQQLQPSELGKIGMILALGSVLGNRWFSIGRWRHLALAGLLVAVPFLLVVVEPDLSGALIFLPIAAAMIFSAGISIRKILPLFLAVGVVGGALAANEIFEFKPLLREYHRNRIRTFLNPEHDPLGRGYNANQARLAVGSGGVFGKGLGQGTQGALGYIPQTVVNNDFIFSVVAEETGFAGCLALLGCYALLLMAIFRTAWRAVTPYGRHVAVGFGVMLFMHVFINIGMSIGLTPVTGLPLPLVSYGGSFVVTTLAMLGVIQSVHRVSRRAREEEE